MCQLNRIQWSDIWAPQALCSPESVGRTGLDQYCLNSAPCNAAYTENEGLVIFQYKCLVPIFVPEMILCSLVISKTEL
jgi:hypothetical protein